MNNQKKGGQSGSSTRGGTSEQHAKAGSMSHKNKDSKSGSGSHSGGSHSGSTSKS